MQPYRRSKRDSESKKSNRHELKLPKLKKIDPKELAAIFRAEGIKLKLDAKNLMKKSATSKDISRPKRKQGSQCAYTYESCDPKQKTPSGCPLCYRCHCEPSENIENQRFSTRDIRIPYKMASHVDEPFTAPTQQEFDYEPSAYTGLKNRDMYKDYIREIISKYPEHMSRKMPDLRDQQKDLMRFVGEMSRADKSPKERVENEDVRYKLIDNAVDLYKFYERAISQVPALGKDGKLSKKKRGTVLEVIELTSDEMNNAGIKIGAEDFGSNFSVN